MLKDCCLQSWMVVVNEVRIMDYFDDKKNVAAYIKMAEGYDGWELIDILR